MAFKHHTSLSYEFLTSFFREAGHFCSAFFVCSILFIHSVYANDIDNLRYPENAWDGQVLNKLNTGPRYLDKNLEFDLPPPPANSSQETLDELSLLKEYAREERTESQVQKIHIEAAHGKFSEIYLNEGPFEPALQDASYHILDFADKEIIYFIVHYKKRFSRPRPSQLLPELELVVPNPGHAAYPSGHATQSMVFSMILGLIDPARRTFYIDYAKDIAKRREIAGVHYLSDSSCGQLLASKLMDELLKVNEFEELLEEARQRFIQNKTDSLT